MALKEHSIHVPSLALEPVGGIVHWDDGGHGGELIDRHLRSASCTRAPIVLHGARARVLASLAYTGAGSEIVTLRQLAAALWLLAAGCEEADPGCDAYCVHPWLAFNQAAGVAHLDTDAIVVAWRQQMVDNLEACSPLWEVHRGDVHKTLELRVDVVAQEVAERNKVLWGCVDCWLLIQDAALRWAHCGHGDELGHSLDQVVRQQGGAELSRVLVVHIVLSLRLTSVEVRHASPLV